MSETGLSTKKAAAMNLMQMSAGLQFQDRAIEADFCKYMSRILAQVRADLRQVVYVLSLSLTRDITVQYLAESLGKI
jgi:hypothetical protein